MFRCSRCKEEKDKEKFSKDKSRKRGYQIVCKVCAAIQSMEWKRRNREKVNEIQNKYYRENKEKVSKYQKEWREKNKKKYVWYRRKHYLKNKEEIISKSTKWRKNNLGKSLEWHRKYREKNRERITEKNKRWIDENREIYNEWQRNYYSQEHVKNRHRASRRLNQEVRKGNIIKPKICSRCSSKERIEGHHHDYEKALDVVWLCRKCHVEEHKELKIKQEVQI